MDQDAFRQLLKTAKPVESPPNGSRVVSQPSKKKGTIASISQPAFHPRKVKGGGSRSTYRDRASERRAGIDEYEKIASASLSPKKRTAHLGDKDESDRQSQYLDDYRDSTVSMSGLNFTLLEQSKAKITAYNATEEDETIEAAFQQKPDQSTVPSKRIREDIIRELKERKAHEATIAAPAASTTTDSLEKAKALGKFRPIGAPNPPNYEGEKRNLGKKKRRKIEDDSNKTEMNVKLSGSLEIKDQLPPTLGNLESSTIKGDAKPNTIAEAVIEEPDNGLDIFSDVEEYKGIELGDDDDEDEKLSGAEEIGSRDPSVPPTDKKWFDANEVAVPMAERSSPSTTAELQGELQEEAESKQPTKLNPLASSAVPSIRDLLAVDAAAEAEAKRKARKEKKKIKSAERGNKELSEAAKLDRDYKKLNSYMSKQR